MMGQLKQGPSRIRQRRCTSCPGAQNFSNQPIIRLELTSGAATRMTAEAGEQRLEVGKEVGLE